MVTDRFAAETSVPGEPLFPAGVAGSQWLAIVVLTAAAAATLLPASMPGPGFHLQAARLFLPLLACAAVVILRRWPLPVLGAVTVMAAITTWSGIASLPFGVLLGLALYFAAVGLPRSRSIALALTVSLGAAVIHLAFAFRAPPLPAEIVEYFVPLTSAWFIADSVTSRRRYQAGLATLAERERNAAVREERVRIAREMHDVVAHTLAVITVQAGVGRRLAGKRPEQASSALASIEAISRTAQDELRVMLGLLRDGEAGIAPLAPVPRLVDVKDLVDTVRTSGVPVELRIEGTDCQLSPSLELSIYRVVQEALTNVVKHASPGARVAAEIVVSTGKVRLDIRDDGGPGGGSPPAPGSGHGIAGMRERIGAFGGWLVAGPAGGGFRVTAEVPMDGAVS